MSGTNLDCLLVLCYGLPSTNAAGLLVPGGRADHLPPYQHLPQPVLACALATLAASYCRCLPALPKPVPSTDMAYGS
eukprot:3518131-Rhodomonas_salina.4